MEGAGLQVVPVACLRQVVAADLLHLHPWEGEVGSQPQPQHRQVVAVAAHLLERLGIRFVRSGRRRWHPFARMLTGGQRQELPEPSVEQAVSAALVELQGSAHRLEEREASGVPSRLQAQQVLLEGQEASGLLELLIPLGQLGQQERELGCLVQRWAISGPGVVSELRFGGRARVLAQVAAPQQLQALVLALGQVLVLGRYGIAAAAVAVRRILVCV